MEQAIRSNRMAGVEPHDTVDVGETSPCLLEDDEWCGNVPGLDAGFDGDLRSAFGNEAVVPKVPKCSLPPRAAQQALECSVPGIDGVGGGVVEHLRFGQGGPSR